MSATQIMAVRTRRVRGAEEVTHLAIRDAGDLSWLSVREVIRAVEGGRHFYIEAGSESLLLSVQKASDGRKTLAVGFEPSAELLLTLPRASG